MLGQIFMVVLRRYIKRILKKKNGRLFQKPVRELKAMYRSEMRYVDITFTDILQLSGIKYQSAALLSLKHAFPRASKHPNRGKLIYKTRGPGSVAVL